MRQIVFLEREELAAMPDHRRVGRAHADVPDARIAGVAVAIAAEQRALRLFLRDEALGAHPARAIVNLAVFDLEAMHLAFAVQEMSCPSRDGYWRSGPQRSHAPFEVRPGSRPARLPWRRHRTPRAWPAPPVVERDFRKFDLRRWGCRLLEESGACGLHDALLKIALAAARLVMLIDISMIRSGCQQ